MKKSKIPESASPTGVHNKSGRRQRRAIGRVVTDEGIQQCARALNHLFSEVWLSVPPPRDAREEERREKALREGAQRALLGSLVYLNEHNPAVARALVRAGRNYAEQALRGDIPRFLVQLSEKIPAPAWMLKPALIGLHRQIVVGLKAAWLAPLKADPVLVEHFVSHRGRVGEEQLKKTRLYQKRVRQRVAGVIEIYHAVAAEAEINPPEISEKKVRTWVTKDKTPARVSYCILGALTCKKPRLIKKMLDEAGRYMRKADQQHRNLDLWGFTRGNAESVKPTPSAPPSEPARGNKR